MPSTKSLTGTGRGFNIPAGAAREHISGPPRVLAHHRPGGLVQSAWPSRP
jgi:hypothetical protein